MSKNILFSVLSIALLSNFAVIGNEVHKAKVVAKHKLEDAEIKLQCAQENLKLAQKYYHETEKATNAHDIVQAANKHHKDKLKMTKNHLEKASKRKEQQMDEMEAFVTTVKKHRR
jgi:hypothetical protein